MVSNRERDGVKDLNNLDNPFDSDHLMKNRSDKFNIILHDSLSQYFFCNRYSATLRKDVCIQRQREVNSNDQRYTVVKDLGCKNCDQGKEFLMATKEEKRICKGCGKEKDIDEFGKNPGCKGGRLPNCKECMRDIKKAKIEAEEHISEEIKGAFVEIDSKIEITIDFSRHKALFEDVKKKAEEEIRPLGMQILYMLKCANKEDGL